MNSKFVKKELVEKQLSEIYDLIQQIDSKMDEVIQQTIDLQMEEIDLKVKETNEQLNCTEGEAIIHSLHHGELIHNKLAIPTNVSSKLHFV